MGGYDVVVDLQPAPSRVQKLETKRLRKANAQTLAKLTNGEELRSWNSWVAKDLAQDDWIVVDQMGDAYDLPAEPKVTYRPHCLTGGG
jgi:hypothetical protein